MNAVLRAITKLPEMRDRSVVRKAVHQPNHLESGRLTNRDYPTGRASRDISLAMPLPLLLLQDISVTFGVTPLLSGAELAVAAGDRVCLVGRNGSGKSTLLRIAAGLVQPDAGIASLSPAPQSTTCRKSRICSALTPS